MKHWRALRCRTIHQLIEKDRADAQRPTGVLILPRDSALIRNRFDLVPIGLATPHLIGPTHTQSDWLSVAFLHRGYEYIQSAYSTLAAGRAIDKDSPSPVHVGLPAQSTAAQNRGGYKPPHHDATA